MSRWENDRDGPLREPGITPVERSEPEMLLGAGASTCGKICLMIGDDALYISPELALAFARRIDSAVSLVARQKAAMAD